MADPAAAPGRLLSNYLNRQDSTDDAFRLHRTFYGVAATTFVAMVAALWVQAPHFDPLDRVALPLVVGTNLMLALLLYQRRVLVHRAIVLAYLMVAIYILLAYNHQFSVFVPQWGYLSENTYWFGALNVAAYLAFPPRLATLFCNGLLLLVLLITGSHLISQPELLEHKQLLGGMAQFLTMLFSITLMQTRFGAFRDRMYAMELAAHQDALTGIANRRAAEEYMQAKAAAQLMYTVVIFDLDNFKQINDQFGHATGDLVLVGVAKLAAQLVQDKGLVARWGGEEFLLILPQQSAMALRAMLDGLRGRMRAQHFGPVLGLTACFGVAQASRGEFPEQVVHRADMAMYNGKQTGRDKILFASLPP